jgi:hypothetical protein
LSKSYSLQAGADIYDHEKIFNKRLAKNPLEGRQSSRPESQTKTKFEIPVFPVFIEQQDLPGQRFVQTIHSEA